MQQSPKPRRGYHSTRRQAQAQETRRQILGAAQALFFENGFNATTIEAIARQAGVAAETVFAVFGSKRAILSQLIGRAVGGDEQAIPLLQRPGPQNILHEADPVLLLQRFAQDIASILERVAPFFELLRGAARAEPEAADLLNKLLAERLENMTILAHYLAARHPLRTGLSEAEAAETIWTLTSPEVYRLLTVDRAWPRERYIDWLGTSLARLLLPA